MNLNCKHIGFEIISFFEKEKFSSFKMANTVLNDKTGIVEFFENDDDYSFKPYKVAISGLYKQTKFTLIKPNGTVLLLDDTCYFIGFDTFVEAQNIQNILNQIETQKFIESFMFTDSKRAITKDLLMRISFANHSISRKNKQLSIFE